MADDHLFKALYRGLTGKEAGGESRLKTMLTGLERDHGSVRAAAAETGVSESTWRRWKRGKATPKPENLGKVKGARRRSWKVDPDTVRTSIGGDNSRRASGGGMTVSGTVTVSSDTRERTLNLGLKVAPGRLDAMLEAFQAGDDEMVQAELQAALNEYIGVSTRVHIDNPRLSFSPLT